MRTVSFIYRLKQEAQEQKKAEEKAKREAIYQDYLKRKGTIKGLFTLNTKQSTRTTSRKKISTVKGLFTLVIK